MSLPLSSPTNMPDKKSSKPATQNVVLPGFRETFSDVLRRYPIETQCSAAYPPAMLDIREAGIYSTRPDQYRSACQVRPTVTLPDTRRPHDLVVQTSNSRERRHSLNRPPGTGGSEVSTQATSSYRVTPDHISQHEEHESSDGLRMRKKHICSICDKDFLRPSSLETHMNSHTGAKPHKCTFPGCKKYFSAKSNMKRHLHKHLSLDDDNIDSASYDSTE